MNETKQVLIDAKQVLIERGWCQGKFIDDCGACCAEGAINRVCPDDPITWHGVFNAFTTAIGKPEPIVMWNDAPGRTKEEVLAAFDRAIAACGETGDAEGVDRG